MVGEHAAQRALSPIAIEVGLAKGAQRPIRLDARREETFMLPNGYKAVDRGVPVRLVAVFGSAGCVRVPVAFRFPAGSPRLSLDG